MVRCYVIGCLPSLHATSHHLPELPPFVPGKILHDLGFPFDYVMPRHFVVCSAHFTTNSFVYGGVGRTGKSLGPNICVCLVPTPNDAEQANITDNLHFSELKSRYKKKLKNLEGWEVKEVAQGIIFYSLKFDDDGASVEKSILVNNSNQLKSHRPGIHAFVRVNGNPVERAILFKWSEMDAMLLRVANNEVEPDPSHIIAECAKKLQDIVVDNVGMMLTLSLIICQLKNMLSTANRFCANTTLMAVFLRNISPAGSEALRKFWILPTKCHLNRMSAKLDSLDTPKFLSTLYAKCKPLERLLVFQVDEVALSDELVYKNGVTTGYEERPDGTTTGGIAKRGQAFYISSLFGSLREIIKIMPICKQNSSELADVVMQMVTLVQAAGFTVVVLVTDAAAINTGMFKILTGVEGGKLFSYFPNPAKPTLKIFVKFDTVHLFKNVRNNWLCLKDQAKSFLVPDFEAIFARVNRPDDHVQVDSEEPIAFTYASFTEIRQHFKSQMMSLLRTCHKLSLKCLYLCSFDRQKVLFVEHLFHESSIASLLASGLTGTALFMIVVRMWWDIHNVKNMWKGKRLRKPSAEPITRDGWVNRTQVHKTKLMAFVKWLDLWNSDMKTIGHRLSKETFASLRQSTLVTIDLCDYLFDTYEDVKFIMLGKIQTDNLEGFFGKLRTLAGRMYRITMVQVMESVKKMRNRHLLSWVLHGFFSKQEVIDGKLTADQVAEQEVAHKAAVQILDVSEVFDCDYLARVDQEPPTSMMSLNYVTGVCVSKVLRRKGCQLCSDCVSIFTSEETVENKFHEFLNRGGDALFSPSTQILFVGRIILGLFLELIKNVDFKFKFLAVTMNQKSVLMNLTWTALESSNIELDMVCDECGECTRALIRKFLSTFSNILLDNMVKQANDISHSEQATQHATKFNAKVAKEVKKTQTLTLLSQQQEALTMNMDSLENENLEMMDTEMIESNAETARRDFLQQMHDEERLFTEASDRARTQRQSLATSNLDRKLQIFSNRQTR